MAESSGRPTGSFLSQITGFNPKSLKNVNTEVTTVEGRKFIEKHDPAVGKTVLEEIGDGPITLGYCPILSPDTVVGVAMDRLLVSSQDVAHDLTILKELGVTHILNVAYGVANTFPDDFKYLTEEMFDDDDESIMTHYAKCEAFIDEARDNQGTVLVHCNAGQSRSSSIALAYVLHKKKVPLKDALKTLQETRPRVAPNPNFMKQLGELEEALGL